MRDDYTTRLLPIKVVAGIAIGIGFQLPIGALNKWWGREHCPRHIKRALVDRFGLLGSASGVFAARNRRLAPLTITAGVWLLAATTAPFMGLRQEPFVAITTNPVAVVLGTAFVIAGLLGLLRREP